MIRIFTAAAVAALIAAPASAHSIKVDLTGKSDAEIQADIAKAAKKVCNLAAIGASFPRALFDSCYKASVRDANARLNAQLPSAGQAAAQN